MKELKNVDSKLCGNAADIDCTARSPFVKLAAVAVDVAPNDVHDVAERGGLAGREERHRRFQKLG